MTLAERVALFERRALIRIPRKANGNVANAARLAGHNRTNFYRLLQRHGLDPSAFRTTT
jgi:two-component system response regulator GlrR